MNKREVKVPEDVQDDRMERKRRASIGLAMFIETAVEDFMIMQRMVAGEVELTLKDASGDPIEQMKTMRASGRIQHALAVSFVFNSARAIRICEEGAGLLSVPSDERKLFVNGMKHIRLIRGINEHGYDPKQQSRRPNKTPSMHVHEEESAAVDETSLIIGGPRDILMGPTNLWDAYQIVERLRPFAGWSSLPPEYCDPRP